MGVIVVMAVLGLSAIISLSTPWVGAFVGYLIAVLNPQAIWWWNFEGLRPVYWVLLPTMLGVAIGLFRGQLNAQSLKNWRVFWLVLLLLACLVSAIWAPYAISDPELGARSSAFIFENLLKIVLLVLAGSICVDNENRARAMGWMFVASGAYLIYWINDRYLGGGVYGRVGGPYSVDGSGAYTDENIFGTLFVAAIPFLWYFGMATKKAWLKYGLWLVVPFAWHGVFLTGSRGALLATGAAMLVISVRSRKKWIGIGLISAFVVAFVWQAGDTMKERAGSIEQYEEDESASGRIDAWEAAIRMMIANPLTGVGPGAFVRSYSTFSDTFPRQAHNTFFQFGGEFGPLGALSYLMLCVACIIPLAGIGRKLKARGLGETWLSFLVEATLASHVGVLVSALFLSFQLFEPFFFLVFMANVCMHLSKRALAELDSKVPYVKSESGEERRTGLPKVVGANQAEEMLDSDTRRFPVGMFARYQYGPRVSSMRQGDH
jgi:putative inorganic carbon (HCO3(-)) transporter